MVVMNKKKIVSLIQKLAQELPDAPGVTPPRVVSPPPPNLPPPPAPPLGSEPNVPEAPEGGNPNAVNRPGGTAGAISSPAVSKMQTELKNLASAMVGQINLQQLSGPNKQLGANPTPEQQQALGRMSFADFITQHYTRDSDIPGVEYDWDPNKTGIDEKSPSQPTRSNVVMDTMQRVGNPKSEFKIDGDWGPRTNASLRNAYALGFGLLEMAKDFNYQSQSYNKNYLNAFKELIPHTFNELTPAERAKNAQQIIPHLVGIRKLYGEIRDHIFDKPEYKPYIEGSQPYATYTPGTAVDPKLVDDLNKKFVNMTVAGTVDGKNVTSPITVGDLISPQTLEAWQQKNMPNLPLTNILAQVKQHLTNTGFKGANQ